MSLYNFTSHFMTPGMQAPIEEVVSAYGLTWSELHQLRFLPMVFDGSARDAGNTGYTQTLRQNLLVGRITASGKLKQWDATATDGTQVIAGILMHPLAMVLGGTTDRDRFVGYVLVGGGVYGKALNYAASANSGIAGTTLEYQIRAQMRGAFQLDDDPFGYLASGESVLFITASATLTSFHVGHLLNTRGAAGAVTLTLPATPTRGMKFKVYNAAAQNLSLVAGTADTMIAFNDLTSDSVTLSTAGELIGGYFEIIGDGTGWMVIPHLWEAQTPTIAT